MIQYEPSKMTYFTTSFLGDWYNHVAGVQKVMGMTSVRDLTYIVSYSHKCFTLSTCKIILLVNK